ncbi:MAG TPA: S4 domain-containing protein, partial [Candidatus Binatia bacterium]|nr:S4 domain-containing protein [Candidatus Binatia bacterium]
MRLNKILAQAGLTSRRGGDRLIVDGHVAVNGAVTLSPA